MIVDLILVLLGILTAGILVTAVGFFILRVPFVPTPRHIASAMIGMIEWKGNERVIDLGAGDGRLLEAVKKQYPSVTAIGCEIVPTVWLLGRVRAMLKRSGVQLHLRSLFHEDVSKADVVFLYLFPGVIEKLSEKFDRELKPGTMVVCQTFGLRNKKPEKEMRVPRFGSEVSVFLYRF